jgi:myo-inositol-1(or 4)-monophosphatase
MYEINELLELSKEIAKNAGIRVLESVSQEHKKYVYSTELPREIKALADTILEQEILQLLTPIGLPILSEESGYIQGQSTSEFKFIIDPLDGTFNFVKGLGPCAISIALWENDKPIFGVIYNLVARELIWGGSNIGAYCDDKNISVSDISNVSEASICTGFPARLKIENEITMHDFWRAVIPFSKVRMLGSAAMSLVNVAKGCADVYSENDIMIWDVAAGIAIVEGAGGIFSMQQSSEKWCYKVVASNRLINI